MPARRVPPGPPEAPVASPVPRPEPESEGGGGTTPVVSEPAIDAPPERPGVVPPETDGGGATTFEPMAVPVPPGAPRELPDTLPPPTAGGGGTTSVVPKILPIRLLMSPLPACEGGGAITVFEESETLPAASRRKSGDTSAEGGGAMTEGEGMFSFEVRDVSRSGAETGGGTTATLVICTGDREIWGLDALGAGGMIAPVSAGAGRAFSRARFGAGATTLESSRGATRAGS